MATRFISVQVIRIFARFIPVIILICAVCPAGAQFLTAHPGIPRIDVHTHVHDNLTGVKNYLSMRNTMLETHGADLSMWVNLGGEEALDEINAAGMGRIVTCISDYRPQHGLRHRPGDIQGYLERGYVGYKIWHGPWSRMMKEGEEGIKYFDDPAHEPVLKAMEAAGMPGASVHIADPNGPFGNRGKWCADPAEFWRQIMALERVLKRHPGLVMVAAHGAWLVCQDAQLDYLRYLFEEYPNFYVDLAATFQYYHLVDHANLKDLFLNYADRLLYGTDIGAVGDSLQIPDMIERYNRTFRILETEELVEGGFFGMNPTYGLGLPADVLEKIYYRNAARIYPLVSMRMKELGYTE